MSANAPHRSPSIVAHSGKIPPDSPQRHRITEACTALGWPKPRWYETSADSPGTEQTKEALRDGASIVFAFGGDGTVRHVAAGLLGSTVPLGILPAGTGNLLATNLGLPCHDTTAAFHAAATGTERSIDVGLLHHVSPEGDTTKTLFLVMAGVGFDARIMADTGTALKNVVGPLAYAMTGLSKLTAGTHRTPLTVTVDDHESTKHRAQTVVIGNCSDIFADLALIPDAVPDDGVLDAVVLTPRLLHEWANLTTALLRNHPDQSEYLTALHGRRIHVHCGDPLPAQVDGDIIADATELTATLAEHRLTVCVPATA